jgi:hypothetical protein
MNLKKVITGASLFIKALLAGLFSVITLTISYFIYNLSQVEDGTLIGLVCLGPFAMISGIFLLIVILWILQELKEW